MSDNALNQSHLIFVSAVVLKNGQALVGLRSTSESQSSNQWGIPGGKVDQTKGATKNILEKTLVKEIKEEVGIDIDPKSICYQYSNTFIRSSGHHVVSIVFKCHWRSGQAKALEDTVKVAWIGPNDLADRSFAGGTKDALKFVFAQITKITHQV